MIAPTQANIVLAIIKVVILSMAEITKSLILFRSSAGKPFKETIKTRKRLQKELQDPVTKVSLIHLHQTFHGGQIAGHIHEWEKPILDPIILQMVNGDIIEIDIDKDKALLQHLASNPKFTSQEELLIDKVLEEIFGN